MKKINIAIEGPVASGKGTTAWLLAKRLGYTYMDTGALYRALTYSCRVNNIDVSDEHAVVEHVSKLSIEYKKPIDDSVYKCQIFINSVDVTPHLRSQDIADNVYYIAGYDKARSQVIELERELASKKGTVIEGRAVVEEAMPDAELKIYLTADLEVRAARRYADLVKLGEKITIEELINKIQERDMYDQTRQYGRLTVQPDAFILDTTKLTTEEVIDTLYTEAMRIINL